LIKITRRIDDAPEIKDKAALTYFLFASKGERNARVAFPLQGALHK